jgi:hypothetical protein
MFPRFPRPQQLSDQNLYQLLMLRQDPELVPVIFGDAAISFARGQL